MSTTTDIDGGHDRCRQQRQQLVRQPDLARVDGRVIGLGQQLAHGNDGFYVVLGRDRHLYGGRI